MKFSISAKSLKQELKRANEVAKIKTAFSILENICIRCDKSSGTVSLLSSSLDITINTTCEAAVEDSGSAAVLSSSITSVVSALPDAAIVEISSSAGSLLVRSDSTNAHLKIADIMEFPKLPEYKHQQDIVVPRALLISMLNNAISCAATDNSRPTFKGVHLSVKEGVLMGCATDGHRLCRADCIPKAVKDKLMADYTSGILLPAEGLKLVKKAFCDADDVSVSIQNGNVVFSTGTITLAFQRIAGDFPDFTKVIPRFDAPVQVSRAELASALARVAAAVPKESGVIAIEAENSIIKVSAATVTGRIDTEIQCSEGISIKPIGLNIAYLKNVLTESSSDSLYICITDKDSPALIHSGDSTTDWIIMPMQL